MSDTPEKISGRALRAARLRAGHTVAAAAALVHVSDRTWWRWEAGERAISIAAAHLYAVKTETSWPLPEPPARAPLIPTPWSRRPHA